MQDYNSKEELISKIRETAMLFIGEFKNIDENDKNKIVDEVDRSPSQMIAYQIGWMKLILSWDNDELNGKSVITPSPDYKWNNLGGLYKRFYADYELFSLKKLQELFLEVVEEFILWIKGLSDDDIFLRNSRKWASSTPSKWPICKWIHINTVAPFLSFRTRIRKWKKHIN